ncbi:hypothetical protein T484DRAFT_1826010 [Baffinella frigidus]|nr:hypothetical protein T484DRAFT_1826010 [Cryptophyta sp. CCMP2293]
MSSSIEPGYYEEVVEAKTEHNFNGQRFLTFDPITFVPLSVPGTHYCKATGEVSVSTL